MTQDVGTGQSILAITAYLVTNILFGLNLISFTYLTVRNVDNIAYWMYRDFYESV